MILKDDVEYIARLAHIRLNPEETERFTQDLESILEYIKKLEKLDISHTEPTSHVLALQNVTRPDTVRSSLPQEEVMQIAVAKHVGFFKVPKIIEP